MRIPTSVHLLHLPASFFSSTILSINIQGDSKFAYMGRWLKVSIHGESGLFIYKTCFLWASGQQMIYIPSSLDADISLRYWKEKKSLRMETFVSPCLLEQFPNFWLYALYICFRTIQRIGWAVAKHWTCGTMWYNAPAMLQHRRCIIPQAVNTV